MATDVLEKPPAPVASSAEWEDHWKSVVPLSGARLDFAADRKTADKSLHLRFASPRADASWGFELPEIPARGKSVPCQPKSVGPLEYVRKSLAGGAFRRETAGSYRLSMATDRLAEVYLQSDHDELRGRWLFRSAGQSWEAHRPESQAPEAAQCEFPLLVRRLHRQGIQFAVLPRDPVDLSAGRHRLVDVRKAAREIVTFRQVVKQSAEQRYTLGVAYPLREVDAHGEFMDADELEKTAWRFMQSPKVGLMHKDGTAGAGTVVESYIYRGPVWKVDGDEINPGDWLLGVVWSEEVWKLIKDGKITGYSMQGWATARRAPARSA